MPVGNAFEGCICQRDLDHFCRQRRRKRSKRQIDVSSPHRCAGAQRWSAAAPCRSPVARRWTRLRSPPGIGHGNAAGATRRRIQPAKSAPSLSGHRHRRRMRSTPVTLAGSNVGSSATPDRCEFPASALATLSSSPLRCESRVVRRGFVDGVALGLHFGGVAWHAVVRPRR